MVAQAIGRRGVAMLALQAIAILVFTVGRAWAAHSAIEAEIGRLAEPAAGTIGVAAWRLDGKGARVIINGNERFPMASTYKIAIAATILADVDAGKLKLDQMIDIPRSVMVKSNVLADSFIHPGVSVSVYNLLELMLTESDNSASDVLMAAAGGPSAVTEWLRAHDIRDQRVDRNTAALILDFLELPRGPYYEAMAEANKRNPDVEKRSINAHFDDDPRDTSTPEAMAQLLGRIFRGEMLSPASTTIITEIMERCRTGATRLRGRLPPGTVVADKTGNLGGTENDVGVITLPGDAGKIIVAIFIKGSVVSRETRDSVIAEIARSVRDFFLFNAQK